MGAVSNRRAWSDDDLARLREVYPTAEMGDVLGSFPGRSSAAVKLRAQKDGLRRPPAAPQGSLKRLLEQTPIAAYWIGFLMADGHFSERRLAVKVSVLDVDHVRSLADWLGPGFRVKTERGGTIASLSCQQPTTVRALRERFDISPRKTYDPPSRLPYEDTALLTAWLIGLIDGDGTIRVPYGRRGAMASVVAHLAWQPLLMQVRDTLSLGTVGTRAGGVKNARVYASLSISAHSELAELKTFASRHRLPVLERKWVKVDEAFETRTVRARRARELVAAGATVSDLVRELGYSHDSAYAFIWRANRESTGPGFAGLQPRKGTP